MRAEKQSISTEYVARLNSSPFFIVVNYQGLNVGHLTELRQRLGKTGAEIHVVKNNLFRRAVKEANGADLASGALAGQLAVVTGQRDISAAAKVVKTFHAEFDKPLMQFGYLSNDRLESQDLMVLADLPSLDVLRGQLAGVIQEPARKLATLINTPATQLAQVIKAKVDKG